MSSTITLKSDVILGVVPTHIKFVGGLVPDDDGKLPRDDHGTLIVVSEMAHLCQASPVKIGAVQISTFPGVAASDTDDMISGLRELDLEIHIIMMVGGANPLNPADEDKVVELLSDGINTAKKYGITNVASTSFEEWMSGAPAKEGAEYDAAVEQLAKVHARVYNDCNIADSCIEHWHLEFLRGIEFATFTNIPKAWKVIERANQIVGSKFFLLMVDAAHCGDSGLTIPENEAAIAELAAANEMGLFHASAKTTRGCLTTDDGWIGALLASAAKTGQLKHAFVELFHHEDVALETLRDAVDGHGVDTTDGRSYSEVVIDGLVDVGRRLNNLKARGLL
jgi:hypothetical protein